MQKIFLFCLLCLPISVWSAETRAVWLTTIGGIDWPHSYSSIEQKQEFVTILDNLADAGINTVLLQTRIRATTIYPSSLEPCDGCLTGHPGRFPDYDPLSYAIEECHKRGMKLHAWIVAIPVGKWNAAGCRSLRSSHPRLLKRIGDEGFLNPEASGTADYLAEFCKEVTENYDIDGIHLDYMRYPDQWKSIRNRNAARDNITHIVRTVYHEVKALKPWVQVSCSPVGKYADTKRQNSVGWNARDIVCQDVAAWIDEGIMDAVYPMMYFRNEQFYPFAIDWKERSRGRIVAPGLGIYLMHRGERNWPLSDITREMYVLRQYGMGVTMFRSKFLTDDTKGIYQFTKDFNCFLALQPAMTWYNVTPPANPENLRYSDGMLSWNKVDGDVKYNVYCSDLSPVDISDPSNLVMAEYQDTLIPVPPLHEAKYFQVTAIDRYGNESSLPSALSTQPSALNHKPSALTSQPSKLSTQNSALSTQNSALSTHKVLIIRSLQGVDLLMCPAHQIPDLPPGHYKVFSQGKKKKNRHMLGWLEVPLKQKK